MASRIVPEGGWAPRLKPLRTPRVKNRTHLDFIKSLPCVCCLTAGEIIPADDPMHIRTSSALHGKADETGGGRTADDRWSLPGCRHHHDLQHTMAELNFWRMFRIDPHLLALVLWGLTGDRHGAEKAIRAHAEGQGR